MKLFNNLIVGTFSSRLTYHDVSSAIKKGTEVDWPGTITGGFDKYENCPKLEASGNIEKFVCGDDTCFTVCKSGYSFAANGSNTRGNPKVRCKSGKKNSGTYFYS